MSSSPNERIRLARIHAGLTQGDLEKASGIPQQTISRIESLKTNK